MTQAFRLKWDEFQDNINLAFGSLRDDIDFSDVTLVCEGGEQLEAHKLILTASSPFFEKILKRKKHDHPLVYLKGMRMEDLHAAMDFMYYGETNICEDNLDSFLAIAKDLMIKGLQMRGDIGKVGFDQKPTGGDLHGSSWKNVFDQTAGCNGELEKTEFKPVVENFAPNNSEEAGDKEEIAKDKAPDIKSPEIKELEEKVNAMLSKTDHKLPGTEQRVAFLCKVCGLEGTNRNVKKHIEAKHLEQDPLPCNQCEKTCRTRRALGDHKMKYHRVIEAVDAVGAII